MTEAPERNRPAWIVPAALAVLVVVLGAVALIRGNGTADPTTPEGALRLYLQGMADRDWDQALAFLDPLDFQGCDADDLSQAFFEDFTAMHRETITRGEDSVSIVMSLQFGSGGFFGGWSSEMHFDMVRRDGFWYVAGDPWPNFRWNC